MRTRTLILCGAFGLGASAQTFDFSAPVENAQNIGYHSIVLSPELLGRSRSNCADLRLKDANGKAVPYVIRKDERISQSEAFMSFSVVRNEIVPNKYTVLEIEAEDKQSVDQIHLEVANADVHKSIEITGSNDRKQWFAVRSTQVSPVPRNDRNTSTLSVLYLPLTNHNYYRLTIADSLSAPLKILDVGHKGRIKQYGNYDEAAGYQIHKNAKEHISEIMICSKYPLHMDRLRIDVDSSSQFYRRIRLFDYHTRTLSRREKRQGVEPVTQNLLSSGALSSEHGTTLLTEGIIVDTLIIEIDNGDDTALEVLDIHIEQLRRTLITQLEPDVNYTLYTGNHEINYPQYDLERFVNDNTEIVGKLFHNAVEDHRKAKGGALNMLSRNWMWLIIGGLGIFMLYMVSRMIKEQKANAPIP